jgi:hypothetical protein
MALSIQPNELVRNLQSKLTSLELPFYIFIQDWLMNEKRHLTADVNHFLSIRERNEIIQDISLNTQWTPIILYNDGYDDDGLQIFQIIHGSKVVDAISAFINDDDTDTTELIKYNKLGSVDTDWIDSRKLRVMIYDNLTDAEKAVLLTRSDTWNKIHEEFDSLETITVKETIVHGHE